MTHNYHDDIPSSSRSSSRSCSRARTASHSRTHRSGSTTPTITAGARLPSRPSSPSRLRSLPSVGLSHIEALALSDNATGHGHGHADQDGADGETPQQLLEDSNGNEDWGRSREAVLPVGVCLGSIISSSPIWLRFILWIAHWQPPRSIATYKFAEESLIQSGISDYTFIPKEEGGLLGRGKFSSVQLAWKHGVKVG